MAGTSFTPMTGGVATALTALAGGGASSATQLSAGINVIGTCATSGDSAKLPLVGAIGSGIVVRNGGAAPCSVYPPTGGTINGGSTDAAFSVTNAKTAQFFCASADGLTWIAVLSA